MAKYTAAVWSAKKAIYTAAVSIVNMAIYKAAAPKDINGCIHYSRFVAYMYIYTAARPT